MAIFRGQLQSQLETLHLSSLPPDSAAQIVALGMPDLTDLSIEELHLNRGNIVESLPFKVRMLRLVSFDQKPISLTFVTKLKRRLHRQHHLKYLKIPATGIAATTHRAELTKACVDNNVTLHMGPETVTVP